MTTETTDLSTVPCEILKMDCKGRVRVPARIREELLDRFESSGMSGTEFAAFYNLKYQTFATWRQKREKRLREESGQSQTERFVELAIPGEPPSTDLLLELPGGARMKLSTPVHARIAAELLKALQSC